METYSKEVREAQQKAQQAQIKFRDLLEEERRKKSRPALRKLVGSCFVYQNSYGSGSSWPLYARVISFNEKDMCYTTVTFQEPIDGRIEIEKQRAHNYEGGCAFGIERGWKPITQKDYNTALIKLLKHINELFHK
jgi:hypothetical protein